MSQSSKHMEWCLNKARKEIEECKKQGKRLKHRGLLNVNPSIEEARKHLAKAEHDFEGITKFRDIGFSDWSIAAGFYSIYHAFLAIAATFGYESSNQTCTIALMRHLKETGKINLDEKFIESLEYEENSIITLREDYTYGIQVAVKDETKINQLKEICKELIDNTKDIIFR